MSDLQANPTTPPEEKKLSRAEASKEARVDALIKSNNLGLKLKKYNTDIFLQNFAVFQPMAHIRAPNYKPRVFIHGRELFSPAFAAEYFSPDYDRDKAPYAAFSEEAKTKVRRWFKFDTILERYPTLYSYNISQDPKLKGSMDSERERHPEVDFSHPRRFKDMQERIAHHRQAMARHGLYSRTGTDPRIAPLVGNKNGKATFDNFTKFLKVYSKKANEYWDEFRTTYTDLLNLKRAETLKPQVMEYIISYMYDPEAIINFFVGLSHTDASETSIERIIEQGVEKRTEQALRSLARRMHNPYDPEFINDEKQVAKEIVSAVNPRIYRMAQLRNSKIIYVENDILHDDYGRNLLKDEGFPIKPGTAGQYSSSLHPLTKYDADEFLVIGGRYYYAGTTRHEFEHLGDFTHPFPFNQFYEKEGQAPILRDREKLKQVIETIQNTTYQSSIQEKEFLMELATQMDIRPPYVHHTIWDFLENFKDVKGRLLRYLGNIQNSMAHCAPWESERAAVEVHYPTPSCQLAETPPVIECLKKSYGKRAIERLLPESCAMVRQHRYHHPYLRDETIKNGYTR